MLHPGLSAPVGVGCIARFYESEFVVVLALSVEKRIPRLARNDNKEAG